jgi:hypothetical protein
VTTGVRATSEVSVLGGAIPPGTRWHRQGS